MLFPLIEDFEIFKEQSVTNLFFFEKTFGKQGYDVAFLGDSRCRAGLLQKPLQAHLGNLVLYNLGMNNGRINRLLLEIASERMKKNGKRILCLSLTSLDIRKDSNSSVIVAGIFCFHLKSLWDTTLSERVRTPFIEPIHTKGKKIDRDLWSQGFRSYRNLFTFSPFCSSDFQHFVQNLKWCKRNNIKVVAYRMVSCREMDELEDKLSGVDWNKIKQAVLDEGFVWLERPPSPLLEQIEEHCRDASHLNAEGAELFSNWLGNELAKLDWFKENQQISEIKE